MGNLLVHFHGICTHVILDDDQTGRFDRVVLLECGAFDAVQHRAILSVPSDTDVPEPECDCIQRVIIPSESDTDKHYRLSGVHLTMEGVGELDTGGDDWRCVPSLTGMKDSLGDADPKKVTVDPPNGVSVWFDVRRGHLQPYLSAKEAVAVQLTVPFEGQPVIHASCWKCHTTLKFTMQEGSTPVRVSNDCGAEGALTDFLLHYQIAEHPPDDPPVLSEPPCRLEKPDWADGPPGSYHASLGCSNSGYP